MMPPVLRAIVSRRTWSAAQALVFGFAASAAAQEPQHHGHEHAALGAGWTWATSARVYFGANLQERKFTDFYYVESQNWFMAEAGHRAGAGRFMLHTMFSLEPVTLGRLGSPQVFQTGETLDGGPLIDYQHPHDFFMAIEAKYERPVGERGRLWISAAPVGEIALGPPAFMHRASADHNPTAPLGHHNLDSTHISRSVVSAGAARGGFSLEGSIFKGLEPDEDRWDLDLGVPDSWSARLTWAQGPWRAQFSGGRLTTPDAVEPFVNVVKLTSSLEYSGTAGNRPLAVMVAVGRNQEVYGNLDTALIEARWRASMRWVTYMRAEVVDKNILTAGGLHPPGFTHPHVLSTVAAFTGGLVRDVHQSRAGLFSGALDFTAHWVDPNLVDSYGKHPYSIHAFLRWNWNSHK